MKNRIIVLALLLIATTIPVFAAGDRNDHQNGEVIQVKQAVWDAGGQDLLVQVQAAKKVKTVTAIYNGQSYTLSQSSRRGNFQLRVEDVCFDDHIEINASGSTATWPVTNVNGSPDGHVCSIAPTPAPGSSRDLVVIAQNDLGMHCACPGTEYFMLLPPYNTMRAQVIERGSSPRVLGANDNITVKYDLIQNTDESLKADPYFSTWMENMPKYGFGPAVNANGQIQGLTGATLDGEMKPVNGGMWEVEGVPAFPDASNNSTNTEKVMVDSLGGPNRNPYITAKVTVFDKTSGEQLTETSTVIPVAFGGCCSCHLQLTEDSGLSATPKNSFELMGKLHKRDSGINFAEMDPDGDGTPGPIRCSACHLDPAMGETTAPGYQGYPTSQYTFSNVLHRWHVENPKVLSYNPDLATDCYACHPGNNVGCFRGLHEGKGLWCTDCHGDLNQRVAEGQVDNPWSPETMPKCINCHGDYGEGNGMVNSFGGYFLNSRGHYGNQVLCSTCHGSPHSLYPSNLAADNEQPMALQGSEMAIGRCDVCHSDGSSNWSQPYHPTAGNNAPPTDGSGGTGGSGGSGGSVDAAAELSTTCLNCHGDKSGSVSCSNSKWTAHNGTRVSTAVYDAVTLYLTGATCGSGTGGGGGGDGEQSSGGLPSDHTQSEDGVMHKPGMSSPYRNSCTSCHGADLRGGIGPSCYSCHGQKW